MSARAADVTGSSASRIPADYVLIGPRGATAVPALGSTGAGETATSGALLGAGFGFAVTDRRMAGGRGYVRLGDAGWVRADQVVPVRPSTFRGVVVARDAPFNAAWVVVAEAVVRGAPAVSARAIITRPLHTRVLLAGSCRDGWCPLAVGWMRAVDLARATPTPRPTGVGQTDRWLDIDLGSQTLVAYQGEQPVFATLVSTGVGVGDSPFATPVGLFAVRSKAELVRMDNLEHTDIVPYSFDVPLAQYFHQGKALHGALWHDRFGTPTSHGCVNLSPADAAWLFDFTRARIDASRPGTPVHVHGQRTAIATR
jgi:lipoprotein-anchoring transpeptidase ErfK/SrfK